MARIDEVLRMRWDDGISRKRPSSSGLANAGEGLGMDMNEDLEKVLWGLWQNRPDGERVFVNPQEHRGGS
jgi:hypothetical protein